MEAKVGQLAPDFSLPDQEGTLHKLSDYRGKWTLVYFYPKDDTPGCTMEACAFRDNFPAFEKLDIVVLGISVDSVKSHGKFAARHRLPFTLLSDENKEVVREYGVWGKRKFVGLTRRMSFLVDPDGRVAKVYEKVRPGAHAEEVLADLRELAG